MWRIRRSGRSQVRLNQFTFSADGKRDPVHRELPASRCDQVEATHSEPFSCEGLRKVTNCHNAAPAKDHPVDLGSAMSETEYPAGRDEFGHLLSGHGEAPLAKAQEDARARIEWFGEAHGFTSNPAKGLEAGKVVQLTASSSTNSSRVRKPSALTTGMTLWSSTVKPRYHWRSS